jgi:hypothetical protein
MGEHPLETVLRVDRVGEIEAEPQNLRLFG